MKPGQIGIAIFVIALLIVGGYALSNQLGNRGNAPLTPTAPEVALNRLTGYLGGEKEAFMADAEVRTILADDPFHLDPQLKKKGSLGMVRDTNLGDEDCLWPSDDVAELIYNARPDKKVVREETIFYSPLVIYSWDEVTAALQTAGVVEQVDGAYYTIDMAKLVVLIEEGATWQSLGLDPALVSGTVTVYTSDPTQSNSGNMFFGLLATALNGGVVPDETTIVPLLPKLKALYNRLGTMPESSGDIFDSFMKTGVGAKPLMAGYESQIVGYASEHPRDVEAINEHVRILYPKPTVWSSHPLIARTQNCAVLIDGLKDDRIQSLAWHRYGFRTGTVGTQSPSSLAVKGIPEQVGSIVVRPSVAVVDLIIDTLSGKTQLTTPATTLSQPLQPRP